MHAVPGQTSLSLHPLVHHWCRDRMSTVEQQSGCQQAVSDVSRCGLDRLCCLAAFHFGVRISSSLGKLLGARNPSIRNSISERPALTASVHRRQSVQRHSCTNEGTRMLWTAAFFIGTNAAAGSNRPLRKFLYSSTSILDSLNPFIIPSKTCLQQQRQAHPVKIAVPCSHLLVHP
jgi:hypothetical protein